MTGNVVAVAARRTRDSGTARVWDAQFRDGPAPHERPLKKWPALTRSVRGGEAAFEWAGVADLPARRAHVWMSFPAARAALADIKERWPRLRRWIDDALTDERDGSETVELGARTMFRVGDDWMESPTHHPGGYRAWILDGLTGVRRSTFLGEEEVRGTRTRRYGFFTRLEQADVDSLRRWLQRAITGNVWVDDDGLVRRVVWTTAHRPIPFNREGKGAAWHVLELWDFGVAASIPVP